jgi:hypothetical protein
MRVHRVCVALGVLDRAEAVTGRRSLTVKPSTRNGEEAFALGRIDRARGWVHVLDEDTLPILLGELSTTPDFIHYLDSKSKLFDEGCFAFAEAETDILAYYLWNGRTFPFKISFVSLIWSVLKAALRFDGSLRTSFLWNWRKFPPVTPRIRLEPDLWAKVEGSSEFRAGRRENEVSVFWDRLIDYITDNYLDENLEFGNDIEMSDYERLVRLMADETRFYRRILAKAILDRADRARETAIGTLLPSSQSDVNYVLFVGRGDQGGNHNEYRQARAAELKARCIAAKAVKPERRWIVGIGLDARGVSGSSEDFVLIDTEAWTPEALQRAQQMREELGFFMPGKAEQNRINEMEYPRR